MRLKYSIQNTLLRHEQSQILKASMKASSLTCILVSSCHFPCKLKGVVRWILYLSLKLFYVVLLILINNMYCAGVCKIVLLISLDALIQAQANLFNQNVPYSNITLLSAPKVKY